MDDQEYDLACNSLVGLSDAIDAHLLKNAGQQIAFALVTLINDQVQVIGNYEGLESILFNGIIAIKTGEENKTEITARH